ncbi:MAG TPA: anti-sigma factor [Arachnia sp.]|nr:anti-sigma factor [Arachnia sp.]
MSEIHGAVGAYVMNALDPSELDEFEAHLADCDTCQREVVEFRETATQLSMLSRSVPPPALKDSVMAAIQGVRVLPPDAPVTPTQLEDGPKQTAAQGPRPPQRRAVADNSVDELALRRQHRTTRVLSIAVAAVTVVALVLGGWVVSLTQGQSPVASVTMETELLRAPDMRGYTIDLKDGGQATFVASKSLNRAMFSSADLPVLQAGQTYQLWTLAGPLTAPTRVTPDALVGGGNPVKQWFTGPIGQSDALAISIEDAGGASAPTNIQGATTL